MNLAYQMNSSFDDGATWYKLKWFDVEFKNFEEVSKECNSIEELKSKILEAFPNCYFKYEYLGKLKNRSTSLEEIRKTRKKK